ncbi:hypothetical protein MCOR27_009086 [Pyricularia oryzae]|uniref:Uncharacterized protein n=2 Tax=Pyricularia TaxID=48558 RepID=A0ABQ8N652_PYRGI|nr:hypothetical protein MCOR01_001376 [Pyricularia oryzae]KAI6291899.1 hypothetical protein MCOR33_010253 [Pyricularia grisea]KAH9430079.1 hypothetical protein MCOR02_009799 [Pyricularia oryzae]KAI6254876.1 hypothetical protein MCOR19_008636 [Pyricularia oryzae]KAI6270868.1 hypothetical protein MCOR27_009086 [Pyricularia oryzae]
MASEAPPATTSITEPGASDKPPVDPTTDSATGGGDDSSATTKDNGAAAATSTTPAPVADIEDKAKSETTDAPKEPIKPAVTEEGAKQTPAVTADSASKPTVGIASAVASAVPAAPAQLPVPAPVTAPSSAPEPAKAATNGSATAEALETMNDDAKVGDKRSAEEPAAKENSDGPVTKVKDAVKKAVEPLAKKMKTDDNVEKAEPENGTNGVKRGKSKREKKPAAPVGRTERKTRSQGPL